MDGYEVAQPLNFGGLHRSVKLSPRQVFTGCHDVNRDVSTSPSNGETASQNNISK